MTLPPSTDAPSLGHRATSGVLWSVAQRWVVRISGLLTVVILARLLTPQDFGLVAVAMAFVPVIYLLADLGFSTYVVQADELGPVTLSTAFWYAMTAGVVFCGAVIAVAPLIAAAFHLPAVTPVLIATSPTIILVALSSVPMALLRRRLAFRMLAIQSFAAGLLGQVVAIVLALTGFGVWALVAQLLVNQLVVTTLAWGFSRFRPTFEFSRTRFVAMTRFGINVIAIELISLGRFWAETAIVTAVLGVAGLGYLNVAQRLIQAAQDLSAAAVVPVSTVVFAQLRSWPERLLSAYRRAVETTYILVIPVMVGVAVTAPLVLPILFGDQWTNSVAPARALAVAGIFTIAASLDNGLFYGTGRPGKWLMYALLVDALTVATTALTVQFGLIGISVGFIAVAFMATVARWFLVARLLQTRLRWVARPFLLAASAAVASAAMGLGVLELTSGWRAILALPLVGLVIGAIHVGVLRVAMPKPLNEAVSLILSRVRHRARLARPDESAVGGGANE